MKILITGGTGFIGQALTEKLLSLNHSVVILTRQTLSSTHPQLSYINNLHKLNNLDEFDAVINLAGEAIFDKAWTAKQKEKLFNSRIQLTQQLSELILKSQNPPHTFLSASATGIYGSQTTPINEQSPLADSFIGTLCKEWEAMAQLAQGKTRLCLLRTGFVLSLQGGMLKRTLPFYKLGLAGKLGSGRQHWSWIALEDLLNAIVFLLCEPNCKGSFNLVSPEPISQKHFSQTIAQHFNRPAFIPTPTFLLKFILGERAALLLDDQAVYPTHLLAQGFRFQYPTLGLFLQN